MESIRECQCLSKMLHFRSELRTSASMTFNDEIHDLLEKRLSSLAFHPLSSRRDAGEQDLFCRRPRSLVPSSSSRICHYRQALRRFENCIVTIIVSYFVPPAA